LQGNTGSRAGPLRGVLHYGGAVHINGGTDGQNEPACCGAKAGILLNAFDGYGQAKNDSGNGG